MHRRGLKKVNGKGVVRGGLVERYVRSWNAATKEEVDLW
jgi:hypothetical protein